MNDLLQSILGSQGNLDDLAKRFNLSPEQASGALSAISRQLQGSSGQGGIASVVEGLLGSGGIHGLANQASAQSGVDSGVIVQIVQGLLQNQQSGGLAASVVNILDRDKDGSVMDDVLDIGRKLL